MGKRNISPLQAGQVCLRLLQESDLPQTLAWRNQDHIRRWFFTSDPLTPQQHAAWFARYRDRDDDFTFIIETAGWSEPARAIGQAALYNIDWNAGRAEFGRLMIGEADAAGRGLARAATEGVLDLAFEQLDLQEVHLDVIPSNVRAIRIYEACGFEVVESSENAMRMSKRAAANSTRRDEAAWPARGYPV